MPHNTSMLILYIANILQTNILHRIFSTKPHEITFFSAFVMATTKQDTNGLCTHRENERERSTYLLDSSKSLILVMKMLPLLLVDATAASVWSLLETNSFGFF